MKIKLKDCIHPEVPNCTYCMDCVNAENKRFKRNLKKKIKYIESKTKDREFIDFIKPVEYQQIVKK